MSTHHHTEQECQELLAQINAYVDGNLATEICAELRQHMADCPECQVVFDTLSKTVVLYRSLAQQTEDLPPDVEDRLFRSLKLPSAPCQKQET